VDDAVIFYCICLLTYCVSEAEDGRYRMWKVLLRLFQDEDERVRQVAAQSLTFFTHLDNKLSTTGKYKLLIVSCLTNIAAAADCLNFFQHSTTLSTLIHWCSQGLEIRLLPDFGSGKSRIWPFFGNLAKSPDIFLARFARYQCNWSTFSNM